MKGMIETEAALIEKMRRGDEGAFETLYARHQPAVYRYALRMTGSPEMADDTVQETFLALLRGRSYSAEAGPLRSYLYGTARNLLFRMWGAQGREEEVEGDFADSGPDPLEGLEAAEQAARVRQALAGLPAHYREAVVLCDLEELSYAEVAEVLGCAVGTIRSRLSRARALLLEKLTRDRVPGDRCRA
jgi:RNA polymerase sigma-70 factor (ECF subfamily)